jgi:hypothetical protein
MRVMAVEVWSGSAAVENAVAKAVFLHKATAYGLRAYRRREFCEEASDPLSAARIQPALAPRF